MIGTAFWALRSRRRSSAHILGAALISGGGFSNLMDRVTQGGNVTDFLNIGVGPLRTGIFNCADVALMLELAILICSDSIATRLRTLFRLPTVPTAKWKYADPCRHIGTESVSRGH